VAERDWKKLITELVERGTSHYKIGLCVCGKITPAARTRKVKRWACGASIPSHPEGERLLDLVLGRDKR
jgi:hypothetical protein